MEVVQIGAVRLDAARDFAETACFDVLVVPRINRLLSDYFIELTGITQQAVDSDGMAFADALAAYGAFLADLIVGKSAQREQMITSVRPIQSGVSLVCLPGYLSRPIHTPLASRPVR